MIEAILGFIITLVLATGACLLAKRLGPGFLVAVYAVSIIIATVVASKIVSVGPFVLSASIGLYSLTFLCTDTLSEFWGKKQARKAIWAGLFAQLLFVAVTQVAILLPAVDFWTGQEALEATLGGAWRVVLASALAYFAAQNVDVFMFHLVKTFTRGKYLWARNNVSTILGQITDTLIFYTIAFYGIIPIVELIIGTLIVKVIIAFVDTPAMYFIRAIFVRGKKWEAA